MPTRRSSRARRLLPGALALGALAVAGAACGEEEGRPIPTASARNIVSRLDEVERRVAASACNDVRDDSLPALRSQIRRLPDNVDGDVRSTLEDGLSRLEELVRAQCDEPTPTPTETVPETTPEPEYTPPPPETTPEPTQPETPTDGSGSGNGNSGNGEGNGNGGQGSGSGGGGNGKGNGDGSSGGGSGDDGSGGGDDGGGEDSGFIPPADGGGGDPTDAPSDSEAAA